MKHILILYNHVKLLKYMLKYVLHMVFKTLYTYVEGFPPYVFTH